MKTLNSVVAIAMIAATLVFTSSCQKEDSVNPANQSGTTTIAARKTDPIIQPHYGSYSEMSAKWWTWALELPVEGHPFIDDPGFDVTNGQSGYVWFLAAPFGTVERTCTIPANKALFVGMLNAEASDLEGLGNTYEEQKATAKFYADHILNVFASLDGATVWKIENYRVVSPQFSFTAPTPWIEGATGGTGTSVADGYFLYIEPMTAGAHTLHFSGSFHFSIAEGDPFDYDASVDMTYHLTVQ
jgi:hypothetical protein